jgi:hypothetical protein
MQAKAAALPAQKRKTTPQPIACGVFCAHTLPEDRFSKKKCRIPASERFETAIQKRVLRQGRRFCMQGAVLTGRHPFGIFKRADEVLRVIVGALRRNLSNLQIGLQKQFLGQAQFCFQNIVFKTHPGFAQKDPADIAGAVMINLRALLQRQRIPDYLSRSMMI